MFPSRTEPDAPRDVRFHFCMKNRGTFLLGTHPAQLVKERQFSKHEDWRFIIKRGKNHDIGSKIRSIPLPNSNLFEIHGSIFKPHPSRNPGQTSVVRIPHGVLFFCISKNMLYGLFSHGIEFLATFGFSQMFDQIEIFLPDMSCEYPLSALICATNSLQGQSLQILGELR